MKSSHFVLHTLRNHKSFSKLKQQACFYSIKALLPFSLAKHINFIYHKGDTVFIVLDHPGVKIDVDYKLNYIKGLLKEVLVKNCTELLIVHIKTFVTHKALKRETPKQITIQTYKERSSGNFKITSNDKKINELFQSIKDKIHSNL